MGDFLDEFKKQLTSLDQSDWDEIRMQSELLSKLAIARKISGLSQTQLAEVSGVKQPAIARLESGKSDPQLSTMMRVLRPLGLTLAIVQRKEKIVNS